MSRAFAAFAWAFTALFVVSAALQVNDPDPQRWIAFYVAAAIASAASARGLRWSWIACVLLAALAGAWATILVMEVWGNVELADAWRKMGEKGGMVEVEREAGGLLIAFTWLGFAAWRVKRR